MSQTVLRFAKIAIKVRYLDINSSNDLSWPSHSLSCFTNLKFEIHIQILLDDDYWFISIFISASEPKLYKQYDNSK